MTSNVTISAAAPGGTAVLPVSPCVLPLVPPYLTFIAGAALEELAEGGERRARRDMLFAAVLFVLGFSTVFVAARRERLRRSAQTVRAYLPMLLDAGRRGHHRHGPALPRRVHARCLLYREKR